MSRPSPAFAGSADRLLVFCSLDEVQTELKRELNNLSAAVALPVFDAKAQDSDLKSLLESTEKLKVKTFEKLRHLKVTLPHLTCFELNGS